MVSIVDAMSDPALFGDSFGGESFAAWRALLGGFYGLSHQELGIDVAAWNKLGGRLFEPKRFSGQPTKLHNKIKKHKGGVRKKTNMFRDRAA